MKKFNKVITVEVSVDAIAQQLLETINSSFPHREMLAETIVGTAVDKGTLGLIYNNLNGYSNEPDFKVGQEVWSPDTYYNGNRSEVIGNCVITNVDANKTSKKIEVEYDYTYSKDVNGEVVLESRTSRSWVSHLNLEEPKIAQMKRK